MILLMIPVLVVLACFAWIGHVAIELLNTEHSDIWRQTLGVLLAVAGIKHHYAAAWDSLRSVRISVDHNGNACVRPRSVKKLAKRIRQNKHNLIIIEGNQKQFTYKDKTTEGHVTKALQAFCAHRGNHSICRTLSDHEIAQIAIGIVELGYGKYDNRQACLYALNQSCKTPWPDQPSEQLYAWFAFGRRSPTDAVVTIKSSKSIYAHDLERSILINDFLPSMFLSWVVLNEEVESNNGRPNSYNDDFLNPIVWTVGDTHPAEGFEDYFEIVKDSAENLTSLFLGSKAYMPGQWAMETLPNSGFIDTTYEAHHAADATAAS